MSKTVEWSLSTKQEKWLLGLKEKSPLELKILGKWELILNVLRKGTYDREERASLNKLREEITKGIL